MQINSILRPCHPAILSLQTVKTMEKILIVDDELSMREFLKILLEKEGYDAMVAADGDAALAALGNNAVDLLITDVRMPGTSGLELLKQCKDDNLNLPVVMITAFASPDDAVFAMKQGAYDYITKPFQVDEIKTVVKNALKSRASIPEKPLESGQTSFQGIVGRSPEMGKIFDLIRRIAPTPANVLIQGESGTGKELVARAIHALSPAAGHAFVPISCNAIPESLFESELFGHVKGSFTGAVANKEGLLVQADKGSAFFDEIGELTPFIQTKLLRVLQEREFKKVGDTATTRVNLRIISATNKDLEEEVINGDFREDLFYRLAVIPLRISPLRERKEDIPLLIDHFLEKYSRRFDKNITDISTYARQVLMEYDFPGNVRELENIIERGVALEGSNIILPESLTLSSHRKDTTTDDTSSGDTRPVTAPFSEERLFDIGLEKIMAQTEKRLIERGLARAGNSKIKAAELLKISFRSIRYKIKKYGIK